MKGDLTQGIAEKLAKLKDLEMVSNDHSNLICGLISLMYDQFEGLNCLYPNPFRS